MMKKSGRELNMLTESMEDYLEMIYRIVEKKGYIRAVDLAEALQLQASSISKMIQKLHGSGFILYEKYRNIALTKKGIQYGQFLVWRDKTLKEFLQLLTHQSHIGEQVEGMEHYITPKTMDLIFGLIIYFRENKGALRELSSVMEKIPFPYREPLRELRAWEFRHSMEE